MNISAPPVIEFIKSKNSVALTDSIPREDSYQRPGIVQSAPKLPVIDEPNGILAESIRTVRTQLILNGFPSNKKTIAVVGVNRDCGTNHFSANLAVLFSQLGKQTLLVDANLRSPAQHQIFSLSGTSGLTDVLDGRVSVNETLISFRTLPNLMLLPAGTAQTNASELISKSEFKSINEWFSGEFEIILYDTPAFIESNDALMIANYADYALLLVHKNHSRLADVNAACKQIADSKTEIIGSLLVDY